MTTHEPNDPAHDSGTPLPDPGLTTDPDPGPTDRSAAQSELGPLYAVAGLTDVLAASLRQTLQQAQERAALRMSMLRNRPAELERQAKINADELSRLLRTVPDQARALPETTVARMNELQKQLHAYLEEASLTYAELAGRGKRAVDETLAQARNLSGRAERKAADVGEDLAEAVDPVFEQVQETVTTARKKATGRTATSTVTSRSAARAAAARLAEAEREAAERTAESRVAAADAVADLAEAERDAAQAAEREAEEQLAAEKAARRKAAAQRAAATRAAARKAAEAKAAENGTGEEAPESEATESQAPESGAPDSGANDDHQG
jgi:hypothetical protein